MLVRAHQCSTRSSCLKGFLSSVGRAHASESFGAPKSPVIQKLWQSRVERAQGDDQVSIPSPLVEKSPSESTISVNYAFCSDDDLRRIYRSSQGSVRVGRLIQDMDALGGSVAFEHCFRPGAPPPHIVTSSVDRIAMAHQRADLENDLELTGRVSWSGQSLMEISMTATFAGRTEPWMKALFSFVALHAETGKMVKINKLVPQTEEEVKRFQQGSMRAQMIKQLRERAKRQEKSAKRGGVGHGTTQWANSPMDVVKAATQAEIDTEAMTSALLRQGDMLMRLPRGPAIGRQNAVTLASTQQDNTVLCHPEHCNPAGRIFGGFLMEKAYESARNTAMFFCGQRPRVVQCGEVYFHGQVLPGEIVQFNSVVLYTSVPGQQRQVYKSILEGCMKTKFLDSDDQFKTKWELMHVEVRAETISIDLGTIRPCNTFSFTFAARRSEFGLPRVLPLNQDEAKRITERYVYDLVSAEQGEMR